MRALYYTIAILFCSLFSWQITAQSTTTITLNPSQDNTLYEADDPRSSGQGANIFAAYTNREKIRRGLIQFDLSDIPTEAAIESASLSMRVNRSRGVPEDLKLHKTLMAWGEGMSNSQSRGGGQGVPAAEGDATWLHTFYPDQFWNTPGGDFEAEASAVVSDVSGSGEITWSDAGLVSDAQFWLENPDQNFGWTILSNETIRRSAKRFGSRESNVSPVLTLTYSLPVIEDKIDLDLSLAVPDAEFPKFKAHTLELTLVNNGNIDATGVEVELPLPQGLVVLVGGSMPEASSGTFDASTGIWTVGSLGAGSGASLNVELFPLSDDYVPYAQVTAANEEDLDSTPNNGACCFENEDDEASLLGMATPSCDFADNREIPEDICASCLSEIALYEFEGATYYVEFAGLVEGCADGLTRVVDCEGTTLCLEGGFAGFRECEQINFFENAEKVEVLATCIPKQAIDLELSIDTNDGNIGQWESGSFRLSVSNLGTSDATGVEVAFILDSEEVVPVGGSMIRVTAGNYNAFTGIWKDLEIAAGTRATLDIQLFSKVPNLTLYAQVTAATEEDVDSTPGNGTCCIADEDDEASFRSSNGESNQRPIIENTSQRLQVLPNPIQDFVEVRSMQENVTFQILDLTGQIIRAGQINFQTRIDMQDLASGVYILKVENEIPIRLVKQ